MNLIKINLIHSSSTLKNISGAGWGDTGWTATNHDDIHNKGTFLLRTEGQGHFDVHFTTNTTWFGLESDLRADKTDYIFRYHGSCAYDLDSPCCQLSSVPLADERIWFFNASSGGMEIYCNGVSVMLLNYSSLGNCFKEKIGDEGLSDFLFSISYDDRVTKGYKNISK